MKARNPVSIKGAVQRALGLLGDQGVADATGKSAALVRKWADPDADGHNIPAFQCVALDVACMAAAGEAPLTDALRALVLRHAEPSLPLPPALRLLSISAEVGDVARTLRGALADHHLNAAERAAVLKEAGEAIAELQGLCHDLQPTAPVPSRLTRGKGRR